MGRPRIAEEVSATFVVNLPELGYEAHVKRCQTLLQQGGYKAMPMTGEYVLQMAEDIRQQLAQRERAQQIINDTQTKD